MTNRIYDRRSWPSPANNPLIVLVERDCEWFSNIEILAALGAGTHRSLIAQWPSLIDQIGEKETALIARGHLLTTAARGPRGGGQERVFSKKALILIAMRAQTPNAAAFRDWLAEDFALEMRLDRAGVL